MNPIGANNTGVGTDAKLDLENRYAQQDNFATLEKTVSNSKDRQARITELVDRSFALDDLEKKLIYTS